MQAAYRKFEAKLSGKPGKAHFVGVGGVGMAGLALMMKKRGWDVWMVLTSCATQYVGPLMLRALTGNPVTCGSFAEATLDTYSHLALAGGAAAMVVAPCSAQTIARLAHGMADDLLSCTALALTAPLLVAHGLGLFDKARLAQGMGPSFIAADGTPTCGTPDAPVGGCVPA